MTTLTTQSVNPQEQLKAYEVGLKETDQIIAIQNHTATVANILLVVTGAIWAAIHAKDLAISPVAAAAILLLHVIACIPVLQLIVSNTHAIALRFAFLREYSSKYYPDIETIGRGAFHSTYGEPTTVRAKYFRWGRCPVLGT